MVETCGHNDVDVFTARGDAIGIQMFCDILRGLQVFECHVRPVTRLRAEPVEVVPDAFVDVGLPAQLLPAIARQRQFAELLVGSRRDPRPAAGMLHCRCRRRR